MIEASPPSYSRCTVLRTWLEESGMRGRNIFLGKVAKENLNRKIHRMIALSPSPVNSRCTLIWAFGMGLLAFLIHFFTYRWASPFQCMITTTGLYCFGNFSRITVHLTPVGKANPVNSMPTESIVCVLLTRHGQFQGPQSPC